MTATIDSVPEAGEETAGISSPTAANGSAPRVDSLMMASVGWPRHGWRLMPLLALLGLVGVSVIVVVAFGLHRHTVSPAAPLNTMVPPPIGGGRTLAPIISALPERSPARTAENRPGSEVTPDPIASPANTQIALVPPPAEMDGVPASALPDVGQFSGTPAASGEIGDVHISSIPAGAAVSEGRHLLGHTPMTLPARPAGKITLRIEAAGYESRNVSGTIRPGEGLTLSPSLVKQRQTREQMPTVTPVLQGKAKTAISPASPDQGGSTVRDLQRKTIEQQHRNGQLSDSEYQQAMKGLGY